MTLHITRHVASALLALLMWGNVDAQNRPVLTLQLGHSIRSMAVVPGDKFLVSAGDNTIKVWDLEERRLYRTILAHEDRVVTVSAHPVKAIVASGSYDNTVRIFNAVAGTEMKVLKGHTNAVMCVKYSPDGRYIASAGLDKKIIIWDGESGQQVKVIEGFRSGVLSVAWSKDGKLLASGHNDELENLFITDASTGKIVRDLKKHQGRVFSVDFSKDGKTLAAGSQDLSISVWDIATATALPAMEGHKKIIYGVSYSPDGQLVATCGGDPNGGEVKIWPAVKAFEPILAFKGHSAQVSSVVFSGDSKTVYSGSFDNTIKAWDVSTGQELYTLQGLSEPVYDVQFNTEGSLLAVLNDGKVFVRSGLNGKTLYRLNAPDVSSNIIFGRTAGWVAAGNGDGSINVWEAMGGKLYKKLQAGGAPVVAIAFSTCRWHLTEGRGSKRPYRKRAVGRGANQKFVHERRWQYTGRRLH
jgi:WD40 repeat protein